MLQQKSYTKEGLHSGWWGGPWSHLRPGSRPQ